ncbi:hypothetical protein [Hymenobacter convexus]|uniref:hypothetical protein n=1 Tax=Hymenobacter sp. CA1UV-4 TaxID=3063782 RepID=UPI0027142DD7|nr:hypothetical protein [Hymenobacter sp. CA1UV-4]MDO7850441.1 hypothetical protein [Hymenobacter sp. CA1UV-4]
MKTAAFANYRHQHFYGHPGAPDPAPAMSAAVRRASQQADAALTPRARDRANYPPVGRPNPASQDRPAPDPVLALPLD